MIGATSQRTWIQRMNEKVLHTIWLALILVTALILILYAHAFINPDVVFTSMIAGVGGIVATRLANNGYNDKEK